MRRPTKRGAWTRGRWVPHALVVALAAGFAGCSQPEEPVREAAEAAPVPDVPLSAEATEDATSAAGGRRFGGVELEMPADVVVVHPEVSATRNAYFGDLHVHTEYSFDAFAFGTIATPYDAYRYAQGEAIDHPAGFQVQLDRPLDFYAVTDHAMFLGAVKAAADTTTAFSRLPHVLQLHNMNADEKRTAETMVERVDAFRTFLPDTLAGIADGWFGDNIVVRNIG